MFGSSLIRISARLLVASLVAVALVACGPGIGGAWSGTLVQVLPGPDSFPITVNITVGDSVTLFGVTAYMLSGNYNVAGSTGSLTGIYGEVGGVQYIDLSLQTSGDTYYLDGTVSGNQITGEWWRGSAEGTFTLNR